MTINHMTPQDENSHSDWKYKLAKNNDKTITIHLRSAKYSFEGIPIRFEEIEVKCRGEGTKENPAIINSFTNSKLNVELIESDINIVLVDCTLGFLDLYYCTNVSVVNCKLRALDLRNCSDILVKRTSTSFLKMMNCQQCTLYNVSSTDSTNIYKSYNNLIEQCTFGNFFTNPSGLSRNNVLKDNEVYDPDDYDYTMMEAPIDLSLGQTFPIDCYTNSKGYISCELRCTGTGTLEDPIIIDSLDSAPYKIKTLDLFHIREQVILRNIIVPNLCLYDCKNVLVEHSSMVGSLRLKFCTDVRIDSINAKSLKLGGCKNIFVENSEFIYVIETRGGPSEVIFSNTSYKKIDKSFRKKR